MRVARLGRESILTRAVVIISIIITTCYDPTCDRMRLSRAPYFFLLLYVTRTPRIVDNYRRLATIINYTKKALVDDSRLSSTI